MEASAHLGHEIKQDEEDHGEVPLSRHTAGRLNMASSSPPPAPAAAISGLRRKAGGGRKRRGDLWSHFLYNPVEGKTQCVVILQLSAGQPTLCGLKIGGKNTTNLKRHLRTYHPDISATIPETLTPKQKQDTGTNELGAHHHSGAAVPSLMSSSRFKYLPDSVEQQSREHAIALWIGRTGLPAATVDDPDYLHMMETADRRFAVPHRAKINHLVEAIYCGEKLKFKERLARARKITICVGSWRGNKANNNYASFLAISACYFCTELQRAQHILLNLEQMTHPHTAQVIKMCVDFCTEAWGITQDKILTVITDSGSHMVAAFTHQEEEEEEEPSSEEEEEGGGGGQFEDVEEQRYGAMMERMPCVVHTLQLVVVNNIQKDASVQRLLGKARALVKRVRTSSAATERLLKLCGLTVVRDCVSRWSSTYLMITRLLQVKDAVVLVSGDMGWDCLLPDEWNKLCVLRDLLVPFAEHTKILQSDTMSLSLIVPALLDLIAHLSNFVFLSAFRDLGVLSQRMKADLEQRSGRFLLAGNPRFFPLAPAACLLDPTVSDILVDSSEEPIQELLGRAEEYVAETSTAAAAGRWDAVEDAAEKDVKDEAKDDAAAEPPHAASSKRPRFRFLSAARQSRPRSLETCVRQELRRYKEALSHGVHEDTGVEFWLAQSSVAYPTLKPLALDLLAMPASQAFTERVFGITGDLTRARRNRARMILERSAFLKLNQKLS